jgi:iron complex outermembrane receptor protein
MNLNSVRKSWAALALFLSASLPYLAVAQTAATTTADATKDQSVKMEKFVVTGSLIPFAADAPAIPIVSVDVSEIERTGTASSVLEVLRKTVPQFIGNGNLGATNANISSGSTNGGSQLSLLNAQTLVLVNGRRVASAPAGANGGYVFVDVNQIPVSAVDRIDVVTDGASAIYGTDAISGVVNIILKSDYAGAEFGARYGFSDNKGNFAERSAWVVVGASSGKTNITVSAEWYKQDPIFNYERPYSAVTYGTVTFPGSVNIGSSYYYLNPTLNAPPTGTHQTAAALLAAGVYSGPLNSTDQSHLFNLSQYVTQLASDDRASATLSLDHKINDNLTLFGDFMYSNTQTYTQLNGQPFSAGIAATDPSNPFNVKVTARNRYLAFPRTYFDDTTLVRGVLGLKGNITADWTWEAAADYNKNTQDYINGGLINTANRIAAVANGTINLFARVQAPGAVDASGMLGTALASAESKLSTYDAKVTGKLFDLPAGEVKVALGAEHRVEGFSDTSDVLSQANTFGWDSGTTVNPIKVSRKINSIFGELRLPLLKDVPGVHYLEASIAGRSEHYSDAGTSTVPKVTLRWLPVNDELAFRGTYGKSFTAPTLFELFGLGGIGFTNPMDFIGYNNVEISGQALTQNSSNPNLKPSTSTNYTFGVTYSPKAIKGYTFSVDYFHFDQKDFVSYVDQIMMLESVDALGAASPWAKYVAIGNFGSAGTPITGPGQIGSNAIDNVYVSDPSFNLARIKLSGFNLDMRYIFDTNGYGKFDVQARALIWSKYAVQFMADQTYYETAGKVTLTNGTLSRWNGNLSADWSKGNWGAASSLQFFPSVTDDNDGSRIPNIAQLDLSASYTFSSQNRWLSGLKVSLGANNVFNKFAPLDPATFTDANADIATYGAIGRLMYVKAQYKF